MRQKAQFHLPKRNFVFVRKMRHIPLLLLLAAFFVATAAPLFFQIRLAILKHEAVERMEHNLLQTLSLSADKIHWEKQGAELRIGERLFDIKTATVKGGNLIVTGVFDDEEMSIEKKLDGFWNGQEPQQNSFLEKYFSYLSQVLIASALTQNNLLVQASVSFTDHPFIFIKSVFISVPSPPPQYPPASLFT